MVQTEWSGLRVVIADTTSHATGLTADMLRTIGIKSIVQTASSTALLAEVEKGAFDLVVVNDELAPQGGVDITKRIRALEDPVIRAIPVIMVFSVAELQRIKDARDAGVNQFIKKPMSPKVLGMRIEALMATPQAFVATEAYAGPDRRRRDAAPPGPERRS